MIFAKALSACGEVLLRTAFYRYDFFDGTNKGWLAPRYLSKTCREDWVERYEEAAAQCAGVPHAVSFGAGRMALYAILEALEICSGDEVIVPAFTCVVVPNAALYRGARPVYADISKRTFNVQVEHIEKAITPRTKAIIAQHTFGQPCDIEAILEIGRRHRITVIEDCAHSFGASYKGRRLGAWGDVAFVSTDHSKVLSTSLGGLALCSSPVLAEKLRHIQSRSLRLPWHCRARILLQYGLLAVLNHPRIYWLSRVAIGILGRIGMFFYFHDEERTSRPERYPVRLSNFQAFVGWHEIRDLERNIEHRRHIAGQYRGILKGSKALGEGAYLRYSVLVNRPTMWEERLGKYFTVGRWFSSIAQGRTGDWSAICYQPGSCPNGEFVASHVINFPTHFFIDETAMSRFRWHIEQSGLVNDVMNV